MGQMIPSLIALNSKTTDFVTNLKSLDSISNRTSDTMFVFYTKTGLRSADDILAANKHQIMSNNNFRDFVLSLGSVIDVTSHTGWTGHMSTAWRVLDDGPLRNDEQHSLDGKRHALYWADVNHELVFILPTSFPSTDDSADNCSLESEHRLRVDMHSDARSVSSLSDDGSTQSKIVSENESTRSSLRKKFKNQMLHNIGCDVKVLIFWMESCDDIFDLPISQFQVLRCTRLIISFYSQTLYC